MTSELKKVTNEEISYIIPPVDIYESENEYVIKAEMPGVKKEGLNITLENNELEIKGKVNGSLPDSKDLRYSEFSLYDYNRRFNVGDTINTNNLSATLDNGLLTLVLPKKDEIKPKKIEVKVEH